MKKYLLVFSLFVFAVSLGYAQVAVRAAATPTSQPAATTTASAPSASAAKSVTAKHTATITMSGTTNGTTTTAASTTTRASSTAANATTTASATSGTSAARRRTGSKTSTTVAVRQATKSAAGSAGGAAARSTPSAYTMLSFVINRGRVFAPDAPGEITALRLSGYHRTDADSTRTCIQEATINELSSVNSLTLSGRAYINSDNSGKTTASAVLCPLSAPQGLTLTLTVDGEPLSVTLPFVSSDRRWRSGYRYLYTVTVTGGALVVEGVTPLELVAEVDK